MTTSPLDARHFVRIAHGGFGDAHNSRAHSLAWFRDRLYVGVSRHPPRREWNAPGGPPWSGNGGVAGRAVRDRYVDQRGEIWRYDPVADEWEQVLVSPLVELPGEGRVARDTGYRRMAVFQGTSDPDPALYVSSLSIGSSQILRSVDGRHFVPVPSPGPGAEHSWSFRTFAVLDGRLHTSPTGRIGGEFIDRNSAEAALVFSSADPAAGRWRVDSSANFSDPRNEAVYELISFQDKLYAATANTHTGFQVWRTNAEGDPYQWRRELCEGASRGAANEGVPTMCAFRDALYIGTGCQGLGSGGALREASRGAELIRLGHDGNWDLIVGQPRNTRDGWRSPLSGLGPGFENPWNTEIRELVDHEGSALRRHRERRLGTALAAPTTLRAADAAPRRCGARAPRRLRCLAIA